MPAASSPRAIDRDDLAALRSLWREIRADLRLRKEQIDGEIRSYPTPIPRCDAQFNHLYEQQARLARELDLAGALAGRPAKRGEYVESIERFAASAPYTDEFSERELRSRMRAALAAFRRPGRTKT